MMENKIMKKYFKPEFDIELLISDDCMYASGEIIDSEVESTDGFEPIYEN